MKIDTAEIQANDSETVLRELGEEVFLHKKNGSVEPINAIFSDEGNQVTEEGFVVHVRDKSLTFWKKIDLDEIDFFMVRNAKYKTVNNEGSWVDYLGESKTVQITESERL